MSAPTPHPSTLRPADAATLIIVDQAGGVPRVLMGKRRMDQVFMPGKYVFPGGRAEKTDRTAPSASELADRERDKLLLDMKGTPSTLRARGLALAAIRETFEETGLVIGTRGAASPPIHPDAVPGDPGPLHRVGYLPALAGLTFFARAITPPGRPRRYDTRFFCAGAGNIAHDAGLAAADGELSELQWLTFEAARELDIPSITRAILEDLSDRIAAGRLGEEDAPVPYYHHRNGTFRRDLLRLSDPPPPAPLA